MQRVVFAAIIAPVLVLLLTSSARYQLTPNHRDMVWGRKRGPLLVAV